MTDDAKGDCPGCSRPEPRSLSESELARIPQEDQDLIRTTPGRPLICNHCGCVYAVNVPPAVFGYLDSPGHGPGWQRATQA